MGEPDVSEVPNPPPTRAPLFSGIAAGLVALGFVAFTWHAFAAGGRLWPVALGCAGLQWTRPDGCVYFAALAGAWLIGGVRDAGLSRRQPLVVTLRGAALGVALYLPWLVFAWSYNGSPVPHTILAKVCNHTPGEIVALQPGWLALRPPDAEKILSDTPALRDRYPLVRTFDQRAAVDARQLLPGRGYLNFDAVFQVYRRRPETPRAP